MLVMVITRRLRGIQRVGVFDAPSFDAAIEMAIPIGTDFVVRVHRAGRSDNEYQVARKRGKRIRCYAAWCTVATELDVAEHRARVAV